MRILVVDDNRSFANKLKDVLEAQNAEVQCVYDFDAVVHNVINHEPELILIDWHGSTDETLDICKTLRNNPYTHHIPIIFITYPEQCGDKTPLGKILYGKVDYVKQPNNLVQFAKLVLSYNSINTIRGLLEVTACSISKLQEKYHVRA